MVPTNEVTGLAKKSSERHFLSCSRSMLALALRSAFQVAIAASISTGLGGVEVTLGVLVGSSLSPSCAIMLARSLRNLRCSKSSALLRLQDCGCTLGTHTASRQAVRPINFRGYIVDTKVERCLLANTMTNSSTAFYLYCQRSQQTDYHIDLTMWNCLKCIHERFHGDLDFLATFSQNNVINPPLLIAGPL